MQSISPEKPHVTPNPFCKWRRRSAWLAVVALGLALSAPAQAADRASPSAKKPRPALTLKGQQRLPAPAKLAGPPKRLPTARPSLLRVEILDRDGSSTQRIQLELLVNAERSANLETQVGRNQYELTVSPASTPGLLRVDVRRRGAESFQISTLVDPQHPALLSRVGSGANHTEIRLLGVRPLPPAKARKP